MAIRLSLTINDQLAPKLRAAAARLKNIRPAMGLVAEMLLRNTHDRFTREVAPGGVPWKRSRRAIADGGRTLFERGDLFNALDNDFGPSHAEVGVLATGGPAVYARTHQDGAIIRPKNGKALRIPGVKHPVAQVVIPARPFVGIDDRDEAEAVAILTDHLANVILEGDAS